MENEKVQVNITPKAAGKTLRDRLQKEANKRGKSLSTYAGEILVTALKDKRTFGSPLKNAEEKDGKHISAKVSETDKISLKKWADEEDTTLSRWCAHLLEKYLELGKN